MELLISYCSGNLGLQSSYISFIFYFNLLERKQGGISFVPVNFQLTEGDTFYELNSCLNLL